MINKSAIDLNFGSGKLNTSGDLLIDACNLGYTNKIDVLMFADSRGTNINDIDNSWTRQLFNYLEKRDFSCLVAVRPRDCTVFLTLLNFLKLNNLCFNYLVAQIGFVDFTPKKSEVIDDILSQNECFCGQNEFKIEKLNKYKLLSGREDFLYSIDFNQNSFKKTIIDNIEKHFKQTFFLETLEVNQKIKLKRVRPVEFFEKLKESNIFLNDLNNMSRKVNYLQPSKDVFSNPENFTYDGVHYTLDGHMKINELIQNEFLKLEPEKVKNERV
jgi:hypothetical protein